MITTTLSRIRACDPCASGWSKLLAGLGKTTADDELLPYADILRINGPEDAVWACQAEPQHAREWRLFAVWCARQVQHLMFDPTLIAAIDVAERYAHGQATAAQLSAARGNAWVAKGLVSKGAAEIAAAWGAAWVATGDAHQAAAETASALIAAGYAEGDAIGEAESRDAAAVEFLRLVGGDA